MYYRKVLNSKNSAHQTHLAQGMAEVKVFRLSFTQCPHDFNPLDDGICRLHGFKSQRGVDYLFQFAVIAFNDVIPVLNLPVFNIRRTQAFPLQ